MYSILSATRKRELIKTSKYYMTCGIEGNICNDFNIRNVYTVLHILAIWFDKLNFVPQVMHWSDFLTKSK